MKPLIFDGIPRFHHFPGLLPCHWTPFPFKAIIKYPHEHLSLDCVSSGVPQDGELWDLTQKYCFLAARWRIRSPEPVRSAAGDEPGLVPPLLQEARDRLCSR